MYCCDWVAGRGVDLIKAWYDNGVFLVIITLGDII